jgi:hypothetical protein
LEYLVFSRHLEPSIIGATANRRRSSGIIGRVLLLRDGQLAVADGPVAHNRHFSTIAKPLACRCAAWRQDFFAAQRALRRGMDCVRLDFATPPSFNFRWRARQWRKWK